MKKLVAIGGGHIGRLGPCSTTPIDKEIIRLAGKKNPRLLFVPTASLDDEHYCEVAKKYFGKLGCIVDVLYLVKEKPSQKETEDKILNTDIIYVGGGSTLRMMKVWRKTRVDKVLKRAYERGIVLSGKSAGSICWFDYGYSNSLKYSGSKNWKFIRVKGLGLVKGTNCPHYDGLSGELWKKNFDDMIAKTGGLGIAIESNCALEFIGGKYFKIISAKPGASAFKIYKKHGQAVSLKLEQKNELSPIEKLYEHN
jgi:dipeptidase E